MMARIRLWGPAVPVALGLVLRLLFYFFGAATYFGSEEFYIGGDTYSFFYPVRNLIDHGTFSMNLADSGGAYSRLPGYPMFIGPFYLIFGESAAMFKAICFVQILLDTLCIAMIYRITLKILGNVNTALLTAFLYAVYPFVIVWTSHAHAESFGMFLMVSALYLATVKEFRYPVLTGMLMAAGFFVRPQLLFLLPAWLFAGLLHWKSLFMRRSILLLCGFLLIYLPWPVRNYVNHGKLVLFRDITTMRAWQDDVLNFNSFMTALQPDWEPQMTQLISNREVQFPDEAFTSTEDSLKLMRAVELSKTCSDGFASFMERPVVDQPCTKETARLWQELTDSQKKNNAFNYYILVPLKGVVKGVFKTSLVSNWKSVPRPVSQRVLISSIFIFRTLLILLGLAGSFLLIRKRDQNWVFTMIPLYFFAWYGWLCFVTRYLEMRYFLPCDLLLLIPASYLITQFIEKFSGDKQAVH